MLCDYNTFDFQNINKKHSLIFNSVIGCTHRIVIFEASKSNSMIGQTIKV